MKKIAVFEVEFDTEMMCGQSELDEEFSGDWLRCMKWLHREEGMGIFAEPVELVAIKEQPNE